MHHAFKSLDSAVDRLSVFGSQTGNNIAGTIVNIADSIYRSDRTDLYNTVSAGKSPESCLHGSFIAFQLADCSSCSCAVVAVGKNTFISVLNSPDTHTDIRKSFRISYRQIVQRRSADDRYHDVVSDIKTYLSFGKLPHYT